MYVPTQPFLSSVALSEGAKSFYYLLPSNGSYVRTSRGRIIAKIAEDKTSPEIRYQCETEQRRFRGLITDKILVPRIMEYMEVYYGKKYTNCAALAHFLTTGRFIECTDDQMLVLEQGMRPYTGQRIDVGDMICILYANQWLKSRKSGRLRPEYMRLKKKRRADGRFAHTFSPKKKTLTADEVRDIYKNPLIHDFHFLVCVAKHQGESVWISQAGHFHPQEEASDVILTLGECEGYTNEVPFFTLLKKRRTKAA